MAKTLTARGSDGMVAIHEPGANLDNPLSNLNNIYFHSGLDYLQVVQTHTFLLTLPYSSGANTLHHLLDHGLGYRPMVLASFGDGSPFSGSHIVQRGGYGKYRCTALYVSPWGVFAEDRCPPDRNPWPAWSAWVTLLLLANPAA